MPNDNQQDSANWGKAVGFGIAALVGAGAAAYAYLNAATPEQPQSYRRNSAASHQNKDRCNSRADNDDASSVCSSMYGDPKERARQGKEPHNICSICLTCLKDKTTNVQTLPCGHQFHPKCLQMWTKLRNHCPNCRAEVMG